jgi:hypothetical protein
MAMLAALLATPLVGCGDGLLPKSYRFRMTVEVETPDGLKSGSSVYEQTVGVNRLPLGDLSGKRGIRTRGEAVAVDLPGNQTLFALIPDSEAAQAVLDPDWHNDWVESARRITAGQTPSGPLPMTPVQSSDPAGRRGYPILVRFRDINDPATVELVDPDNLASSFGAGVILKQITLQLTDEQVSDTITQRLKWLGGYVNRSLTGARFTNPYGPVTETLRAGNFSTEIH